MNKRIFISVFFLLALCFAKAQNFTSYERYFLTELVFNPAAAGSNDEFTAILSTRKSWSGIPQSPRLSMLNMHVKAGDLFNNPRDFIGDRFSRLGFGLGVYRDLNGPLVVTGAQLSFAYHAPLSKSHVLSFGLAPKIYQSVLEEDQFRATDPGDPNISQSRQTNTFFNFNSGLYLRSDRLRLGFSVTNIAPLTTDALNFYRFENIRTWYLSCRYKFVFSDSYELEPYVLLRSYASDPRVDLMLRQTLGKKVTLGMGYASEKAFSLLFSLRIRSITFGYLFEGTNSPLYSNSKGSHMFFIGKGIW